MIFSGTSVIMQKVYGDVPKWLKGPDSKSGRRRKACKSSNLFISAKKKRQFSFGRLSFLFVLFTFIFSLFSLLLNCRFQRKDKSEKRREKVALLRKALNYIIICGIIQSEVMTNEQSFAR